MSDRANCQVLEIPKPTRGERAKRIYKLKHRYKRLKKLSEATAGDITNRTWYNIQDVIFSIFDELEELGVDIETLDVEPISEIEKLAEIHNSFLSIVENNLDQIIKSGEEKC